MSSLFGSGNDAQSADAAKVIVTKTAPEVTTTDTTLSASSSGAALPSPRPTAEDEPRQTSLVDNLGNESRESRGPDHGSAEDNGLESPLDEQDRRARSPSVADDGFSRSSDYGPKYGFRGRDPDILRSFKTSAIDQDQSGDYDPAIERKRMLPKKRKRSRSPVKAITDGEDQDLEEEGIGVTSTKKPRPALSTLKARQRGMSFPVRIQHGSSRIGYEIEHIGHVDNWPFDESHYSIFNETAVHGQSAEDADSPQYHLRRRSSRTQLSAPVSEDAIPDPLNVHSDLSNHPVVRGCVACREQNLPCPLMDDPSDYPCSHCEVADDADVHAACELIIPAEQKRACQSCRGLGIHCSYEDDPAQAGPCDECSNGYCVAGPLPGTERHRYGPDNLPSGPPEQPVVARKFVACTACRLVKKKCSLRKDEPPPCRMCQATGDICDFKELRRPKAKATPKGDSTTNDAAAAEDEDADGNGDAEDEGDDGDDEDDGQDSDDDDDDDNSSHLSDFLPPPPNVAFALPADPIPRTRAPSPSPILIASRSPSPAPRGEWLTDTTGHSGWTRTLTTRFAHPITFLYDPSSRPHHTPRRRRSAPPPQPCSFCSHSTYAVVGLGEPLEPLVIAWASGMGYTEIDFGYVKQGFDPTLVCADCTFRRMHVVGCAMQDGGHVLRRMREGEEMRSEEEDGEVLAGLLDGERVEGEEWCGLCVAVARWRCARHQETDHMGDEVDDGEGMGCGLFLCEECKVSVEQRGFAESVRRMEREADARLARADVGFLREDGLLVNWICGTGGD